MSDAEKPVGACASCMGPASSGVAPVLYESLANGRAALPRSRAFVSVLLHPLVVGSQPILWRDWSRRRHRRACMHLLRGQRVEVQTAPSLPAAPDRPALPLSRAQRAHYRLDWSERLIRNAPASPYGQVTVRLFGVPEGVAISLG